MPPPPVSPFPPPSTPPITRGRPRIGITMNINAAEGNRATLELPADYANAIARAGALPLLLAPTHDPFLREEMIASIDGLLIPGGFDLDPALYGQPRHPETKLVNADRQGFDLAMLSLAEQRQIPTLGICLGSQTMNVHRRGTLHQHLPDLPGKNSERPMQNCVHARAGDHCNFHALAIRPETRLAEALGVFSLEANSRHHQGLATLGQGLLATAAAPDGLVEAFEDPTLPFWVAVQWHPENLGSTPHEGLFIALVAAAARYRNERKNP